MKKVNFKTVDNLKTPEDWMQKALAVPDLPENKRAVKTPIWQWTVTAAACFVTAAVISLIFLIHPGGGHPIEIKPAVSDYTEAVTTASQPLSPTESIVPDPTVSASSNSTGTDSVDHSEHHAVIPTGDPIIPVQPTSPPIQPQPTDRPQPTSGNAQDSSTEQPMTESPHEPDAPTEQSTAPAEPVTEPATEVLCLPTQPSTQQVTEHGEEYLDSIERSFYIPLDMAVFCKITDLSGMILYGDTDLYSDQHQCEIYEWTNHPINRISVTYSPKEHGILPERGRYLCIFYDEMGSILSTETVFLNN